MLPVFILVRVFPTKWNFKETHNYNPSAKCAVVNIYSILYTAWNTAIRNLFNVPRDMHRYLIESILQCLHVKTMLAIRFVSFYETIEASSKSVNLSDLSKMLVKKQMKYIDVPLEHTWKVPVLQELLNTKMNNLYFEGFNDYVITEMLNMLCNE